MKKVFWILLQGLFLTIVIGCTSTQKSIYDFGINIERGRSDLAYKTVTIDGNPVAYLERAGNGETIVLIHGGTADKDNWCRFVRYLPESYHVIAIDLPGHGDNVLEMISGYNPDSLSKGVEKTLHAIGVERFHIAGNSLGGLVSKVYASKNPEKIITIGLFDSLGVTSSEPGGLMTKLKKNENPFDVQSRKDFETLWRYGFHKPPFLPWPVHSVLARKLIEGNDLYKKIYRDVMTSKLFYDPATQLELLSHLKMPVLVIWGEKDRLLDVSSVKVYQEELPQAETFIIKNCGHVSMFERPREAAEHYRKFIRKHPDE